LISGCAAVLAAIAAVATGGSLPLLLLLVGGFAVLAGALELVWGLRHRVVSPLARDAITVGGGTLALAIVLALVADPVSAVGFFGAYAVILGIFLLIAGLSLKWSTPMKEGAAS
jgi:peptidoglycan/LPS O-acetylase OafA/YrhL